MSQEKLPVQLIQWRKADRYFFDTEFMEDGKTIELLSIGIVSADGREFYAVNSEADHSKANDWVKQNVIPHLGTGPDLTRAQIRDEIMQFLSPSEKPEIWAYYADYDWVLFCQLFGRMIDLPKGFPMYCMDLKQLSAELGSPPHPKQTSTQHNALDDARWNLKLFNYLRSVNSAP